ncbi:hypothetical protein [Halomonas rhizosphaerae]|uniref:Uncharacterized protein n=1 Tax=Halomonas rhizosphaerae TaxID=3043296 RepID=A0ABT6UXQ2_9GAMM|nr:hypothetical protein [Halomonas rhizosphaerae]MDI5889492.1 hypothetical protein [Halomonas rhizosphaerae]
MSGLSIAVTHLNTPYSVTVTTKQLALALRHGTVHLDEITEQEGAIIATVFTESTPNLIMLCIKEAGATIESAQTLYKEAIKNWHRSPEWEEAVSLFIPAPQERLRGSVKAYYRPFDPADD